MSGSDFHFLGRLDRETRGRIRVAYALYRDYEALRFVIEHGARGDGDRLALSLADPEEGPFVVVTRAGRFVRCLREGASTRGLEVVSRERVDALLEVHAETREPTDVVVETEADRAASLDQLFGRIFEAGAYLTREEFFRLSALTPLVEPHVLHALTSRYVDVANVRHDLARLLARVDGVKPREFDRFTAFSNEMWSLAHLATLLVKQGGGYLERRVAAQPELAISFTFPLSTASTIGYALRGAWAAARVGTWLLPVLARAYVEAPDLFRVNDAGFGLVAMAARHPETRAEVSKTLATPLADARLVTYGAWLAKCAETALDKDDRAAAGRTFGASAWRELTTHLPEGAPLRFAADADVPDDLALPSLLLARHEILHERKNAGLVVLTLPFVARADAEDLYFAEEQIAPLRRLDRVDHAIDILAGWSRLFHVSAPTKPEGPSRQGPCPCGSGKKFKRCCEGKA